MSDERYTIGQFAARARVSVRTLRHYDALGLLKPSGYSSSGRRWYRERDYPRLQQILTLKLIGLSLDEIRELLTSDSGGLEDLLERQKRALTWKARQLADIAQRIEAVQASLRRSGTLDIESFVEMIRMVSMSEDKAGLRVFFTDEQAAQMASLNSESTLETQREQGKAWKTLLDDVRAHLKFDVTSPEVGALAERWDALIAEQTRGTAELTEPVHYAYSHYSQLAELPDSLQTWAREVEACAAFIARAKAALSK